MSYIERKGKTMYKWVKFKDLGQFYVDKVLVESDIPLFFICYDENNNKYACLTLNEDIGEYLVKHIDNIKLQNILQKNITIYDVFNTDKNALCYLTSYDFASGIMNHMEVEISDVLDETTCKNLYITL